MVENMADEVEQFLKGEQKCSCETGRRQECGACRRDRQCQTGVCYNGKCVRSRDALGSARCGAGGSCGGEAEVLGRCMQTCVAAVRS